MTAVDDTNANAVALHRKVRLATSELLNLDVNNLTPAESLKVDLASTLLLEVDTLQGQQLTGERVDMNRFSLALGLLQKLLPASPLSPAIPEPNFDGAAEEFAKLIEQRAGAIRARKAHVRDREIERLNAVIAQRDATIERLTAAPPKAVADTPSPPASVQTSNQPPLRSSSEPYLRRGGGVIEGRFGSWDRWSNR